MVEVYLQWGRPQDALRSVEKALDHAAGDAQVLVAGRMLQARARAAAGSPAAAFDALAAARQGVDRTLPDPLRAALVLTEAELRVASGDLDAAQKLLARPVFGEPRYPGVHAPSAASTPAGGPSSRARSCGPRASPRRRPRSSRRTCATRPAARR